MRWFVGFFGMICAFAIIGMAGKYGYGDGGPDGPWNAFLFGAIAFAGLFGHSIAVHLWKEDNRVFAAIFLLGSVAVLAVSLTNTFGAMATRANAQAAKRQHDADTARNDQAALARKEAERASILAARAAMRFKQADDIAVGAAKTAAEAATAARKAECDIQGTLCRKKQEIEQAALKALSEASQDRMATDDAKRIDANASRLDGEIEALRRKLEASPPVLEADAQSIGLARVLGASEQSASTLSAYQKVGMSLVLDLIITLWLIAFAVLSPKTAHACPASKTPREYLEIMRADEPETKRLTALPGAMQQLDAAIDAAPQTAANVDELTSRQPKQRTRKAPVSRQKASGKPRKSGVAASVEDVREYGDLDAWYAEAVQSGAIIERASAEAGAGPCRDAFSSWCEARNLKPLSPKDFGTAMKEKLGSDRVEVRRKYTYYQGFMLRPVLALVRE